MSVQHILSDFDAGLMGGRANATQKRVSDPKCLTIYEQSKVNRV